MTPSPLTDDQRRYIDCVEQWWFSHTDINEKVPSASQIRAVSGLSPEQVGRLTKDHAVVKALENRGIILSDISQLLPEQLAVANSILDFSDSRSQKKKLAELGVTTARYNGWLRTERFQRYLRQRAEAMLGQNQHEAHTSLLRNVQRGDLNSIKLYYEMTGRWSSKTVGELNVEFILIKVVEAVQKHVSDPVAIQAIARELSGLVGTTDNASTSNAPVGVLAGSAEVTEIIESPQIDSERTPQAVNNSVDDDFSELSLF